MNAEEKFIELKRRFQGCTDTEHRESIADEILELAESNPEELTDAYYEWVCELGDRADAESMRQSIDFVLKYLSITHIAREYFGRSRAWLSQKLNGSTVNGRPAKFSAEEKATLKNALRDIGERIVHISESI